MKWSTFCMRHPVCNNRIGNMFVFVLKNSDFLQHYNEAFCAWTTCKISNSDFTCVYIYLLTCYDEYTPTVFTMLNGHWKAHVTIPANSNGFHDGHHMWTMVIGKGKGTWIYIVP